MDTHTLALAMAYLGSAIGVVMVMPQILRIVANPHLDGVSPWTWALTSVSCTLWLTYGLRSGSLPQIPGNVLLITGAVAIVLLVPAAWSRSHRALALGGTGLALVLASTRLSPQDVGFLAFGIGLFGMWPQVYETVWARRGLGASAISLTSIGLKIASQVSWLTFAVLTTDLPVAVAGVMSLTTNGLVASVELGRRRGAPVANLGLAPEPVGARA
jgi:uncharacterized protein with PQ loop repeat